MRETVVFAVVPYLALAMFMLAVLWRLLRSSIPDDPARARCGEVFAIVGAPTFRLFRLSLVGLLVGHLLGVALPERVLLWNQVPLRLLLLEATGFGLGLITLWGFCRLLLALRRLPERGADLASMDVVLLTLIAAVLVSGLATAVLYRWGSSWFASALSPYLSSVAVFSPEPALIAPMPLLVKLHLLASMLLLPVLPMSSLGAWLPARLPAPATGSSEVLEAQQEGAG